jgi:hypothetical protein
MVMNVMGNRTNADAARMSFMVCVCVCVCVGWGARAPLVILA